jgi:hypothetical protein
MEALTISFKRHTAALILTVLAMLVVASCSSESQENSFSRISSTDRIITETEVVGSQFKDLKHYKLDDLPGASAAIYGFMKSGSDAFDYEVRIYESHEQAVDLGTALAGEGAGPGAALTESDAVFKEGVKDRRLAYGADRGAAGPKYGAYMIYENLIVLCQGATYDQSIERCEFFVSELD